MRFFLVVGVLLAAISVSGFAQQNNTLKAKRSTPERPAKPISAPVGKAASPTSKDLQTIERQTAKSSAPSRSAGKRTTGTAPALKPVKDKPNPPINLAGSSGGKNAGLTKQRSNAYAGRLKQKSAHN